MECIDWKYQPNFGYETYALFKMQSEGMKALVYPIMTKTQRPTGTNYNKKKFYDMGFSYKALGYTSFYGIGILKSWAVDPPKAVALGQSDGLRLDISPIFLLLR